MHSFYWITYKILKEENDWIEMKTEYDVEVFHRNIDIGMYPMTQFSTGPLKIYSFLKIILLLK